MVPFQCFHSRTKFYGALYPSFTKLDFVKEQSIVPYQPTNFCLGPNICKKFLTLKVKSQCVIGRAQRDIGSAQRDIEAIRALLGVLRELSGALRGLSGVLNALLGAISVVRALMDIGSAQ